MALVTQVEGYNVKGLECLHMEDWEFLNTGNMPLDSPLDMFNVLFIGSVEWFSACIGIFQMGRAIVQKSTGRVVLLMTD